MHALTEIDILIDKIKAKLPNLSPSVRSEAENNICTLEMISIELKSTVNALKTSMELTAEVNIDILQLSTYWKNKYEKLEIEVENLKKNIN